MSQADSPNTTSPSRRALLVGAPAVAAVALTAGTIHDAIERHRASRKAVDAETNFGCDLQELVPVGQYGSYLMGDEVTIDPDDDPVWIAHIRRLAAIYEESERLTRELLFAEPKTLAGLAALLEHTCKLAFAEESGKWPSDVEDDELAELAEGDDKGFAAAMCWRAAAAIKRLTVRR